MSYSSQSIVTSSEIETVSELSTYQPIEVDEIFPDNLEGTVDRIASRNLLELSFNQSLMHEQLDHSELCSYEEFHIHQSNLDLSSSSNKNSAHELTGSVNKSSISMLPRMNTISYSLHRKLEGDFDGFPPYWKKYTGKRNFLTHNNQPYKTLLPNSFGCLLSRKAKSNFQESSRPYLPLDVVPELLTPQKTAGVVYEPVERNAIDLKEANNDFGRNKNLDGVLLDKNANSSRFYSIKENLDCIRSWDLPSEAKISSFYPHYFSVTEKKPIADFKGTSQKDKTALFMMSLDRKLSHLNLGRRPLTDQNLNYSGLSGLSRYLEDNPFYTLKDENFYKKLQSYADKTQHLEKNITPYRANNLFRTIKEPPVVKIKFETGRERPKFHTPRNVSFGSPLSVYGATQKLHMMNDDMKTQDLVTLKPTFKPAQTLSSNNNENNYQK